MLTILSALVSLLSFRVRSRASLELELVAPWQNAYVERLIGSIRRECLDHMIVFGEAHLRRILGAYAAYYNESRTHRSLNKDAPMPRGEEAAHGPATQSTDQATNKMLQPPKRLPPSSKAIVASQSFDQTYFDKPKIVRCSPLNFGD